MYLLRAFRRIAIPLLPLALFLIPMASARAAEPLCPNETLRVENNSSQLPDCRAYEQVSPVEKEDGRGGVFYFDARNLVEEAPALEMRSLADGSAITYAGEPFYRVVAATREKLEREGIFREQYTSKWSPTGWNTVNGNALVKGDVPTPELPTPAETDVPFVEGAHVIEETPNGSKVFFVDAADTAPNEPDLYEYDVPSKQLTDLTVDKNGGEYADVQGLLGVGGEGAEEGSYVYFVAGGRLSSLASAGGCFIEAQNDHVGGTGCNLYMSHAGQVVYIATLSANDENEGKDSLGSGDVDWAEPTHRTAEVSPNGRYVAFGSDLALTGQGSGVHQIFRYDADTQKLICVSCDPRTSGPQGGAINLVSTSAAINGVDRQRYMLNDGRVFFDTAGSFTSQDVNKQTDVYEWEPSNIGDCSVSSVGFSALSGGCIGLISGGTSEVSDAVLADVSADGSDVFFTTSQSLVPQDQDEITDVYDAREDGGFPPAPAPACPAEAACPNGPSSPPDEGTPPTSVNTGLEPPGQSTNTLPGSKPKATNAQLLVAAVRTCKKAHAHSKKARASCEQKARAKYAPKKSRTSKKKESK